MADRFVFDLDTPYPDVIIETIRQAVVQAIADLGNATTGVDDAYFLTDLILSLLDGAAAERAQLRTDLDALAARVTALEPPPPPGGISP